MSHPRLRRTSPLSHYAAAAALEAAGSLPPPIRQSLRLGLVMCLDAGCVQYSCRFFEEVLRDPSTASPLLFPETVFSAPASHVAALFDLTPVVYTMVGDAGAFLDGMALASDWLLEGEVEVCVVAAAEEVNWLLADALWQLEHAAVLSAGAGAVALTLRPELSLGAELAAITDAHTFAVDSRDRAAHRMREQLGAGDVTGLLCDSSSESYRQSAAEGRAWKDWSGPRISPKRVLGEGLAASSAWQCVAACEAVASGRFTRALVSVVGASQQAIGARFVHHAKLGEARAL
jgi:3-oxoacyl-(acyl-carrier-protein) synthase